MEKVKERDIDLNNWKDVTEFFSEEERHYNNTYMEINEVYDGVIEVSLFSSKDGPYEIYLSYGTLYGIIYVDEEKVVSKREEISFSQVGNSALQHWVILSYLKYEFINSFCDKHKVCMPNDIFFDSSDLFDF